MKLLYNGSDDNSKLFICVQILIAWRHYMLKCRQSKSKSNKKLYNRQSSKVRHDMEINPSRTKKYLQ